MNGSTVLRECPGYTYLLLLRAVGSIIIWVDFTLIFSSLSYYWQANAITIGIASALYGLPGLLLGPYFGKLADIRHPISLLRASYSCRAATSLLLMLSPNVDVFVVLVFLKGLSNLGSMPAEQVMIRLMLSPAQVIENARWSTVIDQSLKVAAPLIGAMMTVLCQPQLGFLLPSALALAALPVLHALKQHYPRAAACSANAKRPEPWALIELCLSNVGFRTALVAVLIQTAVLGLYDPLLALFLKQQAFPAGTFGTIVSCTAAGGVAGAVIFKRMFAATTPVRVASIGLTGFGLTVVLPGGLSSLNWPLPEYALLALWIANGGFYGITAMTFGVVMQAASPSHSLGTISATARSVQLGTLVLGPLIGSTLARISSIPTVFLISGIAAVVAGAWLYAHCPTMQTQCDNNTGQANTGSTD
ncbi:MFS transporter [Trinickia symbiotica]|uniref:MFS transporter n=1 Tax=Trinickia symbiotica TaxID=863227 RepID=A0A2N7X6T2_9BURK|nr:MFS transporter [Trinickia symbiotica]PMS37469.1 MFS transporter [Trinickia symbiotica]PPK44128.1 MFS transporter [Trinickia symbiotica]